MFGTLCMEVFGASIQISNTKPQHFRAGTLDVNEAGVDEMRVKGPIMLFKGVWKFNRAVCFLTVQGFVDTCLFSKGLA